MASSPRTTRSSPCGRRPTPSRSSAGLRWVDRARSVPLVLESEDERWMVRRDPAELVVGRKRVDSQEAPHLPGPLLDVQTQQRELLGIRQLLRAEAACLATTVELALLGHAEVADPLGRPTRRQQVGPALELEGVDGSGADLAALPAPDSQRLRALHSQPNSVETGDQAIEDIPREPAGLVEERSFGHNLSLT